MSIAAGVVQAMIVSLVKVLEDRLAATGSPDRIDLNCIVLPNGSAQYRQDRAIAANENHEPCAGARFPAMVPRVDKDEKNSVVEAVDELYPGADPYRAAWLAVGQGHELYFEESGRPDGVPVVFLHGGPGSSCTPAHRRFFDPGFFRAILFDQRGCGRSRPGGSIESNTTAHLVEDLERLREHLDLSRWIVFGGSWGSTLALAYARRFPHRVQSLVLRGVFLARACEVESFACGLRAFLPEAWSALAALFDVADPTQARAIDLAARCADAVLKGPPQLARDVAGAWARLESEAMAMTTPEAAAGAAADPLNPRVRIYMHYLANQYFLREAELLEDLERLREIPIDIVQGRLDPVCPPVSAWELAQRLPHARLHMVRGAGHGVFEPALSRALVSIMNAQRERPPP